ncbi:hypothetical protein H5410_026572 [Solanum commersonii]|uniref:Uncharacterized protein n=1 Tax=Solanum commersonii TaxID=4109 RepID=A0A9J5YZ81_SOLCO|nr:hypothetical protein H5410_026572 [Solanum commersonii]
MHEREKSSLYNFFKQTLSPSYFLGTISLVKSHTSIGTSYPFSKLLAASIVQYRKMYSNISKNRITSFPKTISSQVILFLICQGFSKLIFGGGYTSLISISSRVTTCGVLLSLQASSSAFDGKKL